MLAPEGECTIMNYRTTGEFPYPFRIFPYRDNLSPNRVEMLIKVQSCFPSDIQSTNVSLKLTSPLSTRSVVPIELATDQSFDYSEGSGIVEWKIGSFKGG
jgi:hypothetical protein